MLHCVILCVTYFTYISGWETVAPCVCLTEADFEFKKALAGFFDFYNPVWSFCDK